MLSSAQLRAGCYKAATVHKQALMRRCTEQAHDMQSLPLTSTNRKCSWQGPLQHLRLLCTAEQCFPVTAIDQFPPPTQAIRACRRFRTSGTYGSLVHPRAPENQPLQADRQACCATVHLYITDGRASIIMCYTHHIQAHGSALLKRLLQLCSQTTRAGLAPKKARSSSDHQSACLPRSHAARQST